MKRRMEWKIILLFACLLLFAAWLNACKKQAADQLVITIPYTEKSDCIIIQQGDSAMMIDTAYDHNAQQILSLLNRLSIDSLNHLMITHLDKDHVGGADVLISSINIGTIYQAAYTKDNKQVNQYLRAAIQRGIEPVLLKEKETLSLGTATVELLPAQKSAYDQENDYSMIIRVIFGDKVFLFMGDAEEERLAEFLEDNPSPCDFMKIPHHGKSNAMTGLMIEQTKPVVAVITCSPEEAASDETLELLENAGTQVYLTQNDEVQIICGGQELFVTQ